ncbi:unnamed protein product [Larinioides sclopetarius]|uniref:Uncharacterized protein n=1 Tax=Larinioides sclopetarius TaxID=280406 RepID=A0AAV2BG24_9ARAC
MLPVLLLNLQLVLGGGKEFPDPQKEWRMCGMPRPAFVCDPHFILPRGDVRLQPGSGRRQDFPGVYGLPDRVRVPRPLRVRLVLPGPRVHRQLLQRRPGAAAAQRQARLQEPGAGHRPWVRGPLRPGSDRAPHRPPTEQEAKEELLLGHLRRHVAREQSQEAVLQPSRAPGEAEETERERRRRRGGRPVRVQASQLVGAVRPHEPTAERRAGGDAGGLQLIFAQRERSCHRTVKNTGRNSFKNYRCFRLKQWTIDHFKLSTKIIDSFHDYRLKLLMVSNPFVAIVDNFQDYRQNY